MKKCQACGKELAEGQRFCTFCGAAVTEPPASDAAATYCARCGAGLQAGARFCSRCGAPVAAALKQGEQSTPSQSSGQTSPQGIPEPRSFKAHAPWRAIVALLLGAAFLVCCFFGMKALIERRQSTAAPDEQTETVESTPGEGPSLHGSTEAEGTEEPKPETPVPQEEKPPQEEGTAPEQQEDPALQEPSPQEAAPEAEPGMAPEYQALLWEIRDAIRGGAAASLTGLDEEEIVNAGYSEAAAAYFYAKWADAGQGGSDLNETRYALLDLDGNGMEELLLTVAAENVDVIYTLNDGSLKVVRSFIYRDAARVLGTTVFAYGAMSAAQELAEFFVLDPGAVELRPVLAICEDYLRGDPEYKQLELPFAYEEDGTMRGTVIDRETVEALSAPYLNGAEPSWLRLEEMEEQPFGSLYDAYLHHLTVMRPRIQGYWANGQGNGLVVLRDVCGDETPELLYVAVGVGSDSWQSTLYIYGKGADGGLRELYSEDWDYAAGGGLRYALFTAKMDGEPPCLYTLRIEAAENHSDTLYSALRMGEDGRLQPYPSIRHLVWGQNTAQGYVETGEEYFTFRNLPGDDGGVISTREEASPEAFLGLEADLLSRTEQLLMKRGFTGRTNPHLDELYETEGDAELTWQEAVDLLKSWN